MFGQLYFDLVRFVGDLQLRVQSTLSLLQPVCQLPPRLVELERGKRKGREREMREGIKMGLEL